MSDESTLLIVFVSNTVLCLCESILLIVFVRTQLYLYELIVFNSNTVLCLCESILLIAFVSNTVISVWVNCV